MAVPWRTPRRYVRHGNRSAGPRRTLGLQGLALYRGCRRERFQGPSGPRGWRGPASTEAKAAKQGVNHVARRLKEEPVPVSGETHVRYP